MKQCNNEIKTITFAKVFVAAVLAAFISFIKTAAKAAAANNQNKWEITY